MSCPCEKHGPYSMLPSISSNSSNKRVVSDPVYISKSAFAKQDKLSLLKFAHCSDKPSFVAAFSPYLTSTEFSQGDLQKLADLWETGADRKNGFSIERIFGSISTNLKNLGRCSNIKWTD